MAGKSDDSGRGPGPAVDRLIADAADLLGPVQLVDDLTFSRKATVVRLRVAGGTTMIAKQPRRREMFVRELEALRLLPPTVRPALLASSSDLFVIEDLGSGPSLADLLLGNEANAAEQALMGWAETLGHALRATLREGQAAAPEEIPAGVEGLKRLSAQLDVEVGAGVDDDAALIADTLARTGPWLAYCPSDTCPDNNRVSADGSVRLFDFEGAGWRHAALEAAYCLAPFCTCWCVARLPDGMTERMEEAFLAKLAPPDAVGFRKVVPLAAVSYTLVGFESWFPRFVLEDRPPGPPGVVPSTGRQYVYEQLIAVAALDAELPALAKLARDLAARIAWRWPEATAMPLYQAFRPVC